MRLRLGVGFLALVLIPVETMGYEETTVTNGGTVAGFVRVQGKVPKLPPLEVFKFKEVCKDVPDESLVVGPGRGLRYAVATLEGISKGKATERETVHELDNFKCRFVPHVQAASVGHWLLIKNSDPILHTAHAFFSDGQPHFNVALPPGKTVRKPLISSGLVRIICEVRHTWMSAHIMVTDHPYHAVTDVYGEYEIRDVPPGTYGLKVWHERLGTQEKQVEVKAGAVSKADFVLKVSEGAKK
jgi:hypothetical protein